ncbi:MAG: hypothetical protein AAF466_13400 [Bacteroidota bacterium]
MKDEHVYCPACGYPQRGTAGEKSKFHARRVMSKSKANQAPVVIRQARNILFIIAGITFVYGLYLFFVYDDIASLIAAAVMTSVYVILGYWSQHKRLIALVLALLVYATNLVVNAIAEPDTIIKGVILKIIIIYFLARGINSALHLRRAQQ